MILWRICKRKWASSAFNGVGAAENPGRWNSAGKRAVYCAESRALAAWEILANTVNKRRLRFAKFVMIPLVIPDDLIVCPTRFPPDWARKPPPASTRHFGDRFLAAGKHPVLRVPSATVKGEFCFLLNPLHADFGEITLCRPEPFFFDRRAIGR